MTEAEWATSPDGRDLLFMSNLRLETWPIARTPRLLACAACRLEWDKLSDPRSREAIEVAERYCDGEATRKSLAEAHRAATVAYREARARRTSAHIPSWAVSKATRPNNPMGAMLETLCAISGGEDNPWCGELAVMIRDAFGPRLYRQVAFDPCWRTSTVMNVASTIYEERAFQCLPILADALMDANCSASELIDHLQANGPHIRGCWVLDLVLNKE